MAEPPRSPRQRTPGVEHDPARAIATTIAKPGARSLRSKHRAHHLDPRRTGSAAPSWFRDASDTPTAYHGVKARATAHEPAAHRRAAGRHRKARAFAAALAAGYRRRPGDPHRRGMAVHKAPPRPYRDRSIAHPCKSATRTIILAFIVLRSYRTDRAVDQGERRGAASRDRARAPEHWPVSGHRRKAPATRRVRACTTRIGSLRHSRAGTAMIRALAVGPEQAARAAIGNQAYVSAGANRPTTAGIGDRAGHRRDAFPDRSQPRHGRTLAPCPCFA